VRLIRAEGAPKHVGKVYYAMDTLLCYEVGSRQQAKGCSTSSKGMGTVCYKDEPPPIDWTISYTW
jgi:hypothetical protein